MNQSDVDELLAHPSESLSVELKTWIDPRNPDGICKIARACLALYNRGGGYLVIGFDDRTLAPDAYRLDEDLRVLFHIDALQSIISRYANDLFEVTVWFGVRDRAEYPVIEVPAGVKSPVVAKRDLRDDRGNVVIAVGDVYVRTLGANGKPSTSKARPEDWKTVLDVCFENREADIGRFLRRHLGGTRQTDFIGALANLQAPTLKQRAHAWLTEGQGLAEIAFSQREQEDRPPLGGGWSVALVLDEERPEALPNRQFLQTVAAANPRYTGWPIWLDSQGFSDARSSPVVKGNGWEATISSSHGWSRHYDFMRFEPSGRFYLWRALQDDLTDKVEPGTALDPFIMLLRVSEAIAVGLQISRACGWGSEARLGFAFEWTGLMGRRLEGWANPLGPIAPNGTAHIDAVESYVELPNDTPLNAIAPHLRDATLRLFVAFDGVEPPDSVFEEWARRLVDRDFS